jgi:rod shape-determining protein MreD
MRTFAVIAVAAGFGVLLETTLLPVLPFGGAAPDVLLVLCVYLGLHNHTVGGALGAFLLGYLQDAVSGSATGLNAFSMCVIYLFVYLTCRRLWVDNVVSKVVLVFLASVIKTVVAATLLVLFIAFEGVWSMVLWSLILHSVLAAAIAPMVFSLLSGFRLREEREASP